MTDIVEPSAEIVSKLAARIRDRVNYEDCWVFDKRDKAKGYGRI